MDYFSPVPGLDRPVDFSSSILLLPQPSLASLAQLGADLIVTNFRLTRIGFLGLRDHVPAVSGVDRLSSTDATDGLAYSVEVYQTPSRSLTVVLPRTPVIRARRPHHLAAMRRFIKEGQFKEVLIVAGVDAALRGDDGLNSVSPLRHFHLPSSPPSTLALSSVSSPYATPASSTTSASASLPLMPHGGITRKLLETLATSSTTDSSAMPPTSTLLIYTFEATEPTTACFLADALVTLLNDELKELEQGIERLRIDEVNGAGGTGETQAGVKWTIPESWESGLMGPELAVANRAELFG